MTKTRKLLVSILVIALCLCLSAGLIASAETPRTMTKITTVTSAAFINFNEAATLAPGEGINMEFYVDAISGTEDEGMFSQIGFAVGDMAAAGDHYAYGTTGSFVFAQNRELGVFSGKSGANFDSYSGVGEDLAPITSTGSWNWTALFAAGNWIKVEYKSASSQTAQDGFWKIYSRIGDVGDYESEFIVENLSYTDNPYGNVYFGICTQFAFSITLADLSVVTTESNTELELSIYSAERGTVETYIEGGEGGEEGGEGGDDIVDTSSIPVVEGVSEITFVGIGGKNEAVNRYANITANQGEVVTMTMEVQKVDNSVMSYPNFGFAVSDTAAVGQMYAAGNAGSWIYGGKGDTTVRLYSKLNGAVLSGDTPMGTTVTGSFPHDTAVVAGKTLKVEYKPASSGVQDGYWKIYSKTTGSDDDFALIASVEGLGATDAPSGSVYFGIHTYRTYKITAKIKLVAGGTSYSLNGGELVDVQETFKIGDKEIISKTDMSFGEIGNANGQSAIANKTAVVLPAGGTITMEGVILSADIDNVPTWSNMGFSVGNAYSQSYLYAGSKGSFFFGHTDRALLIYVDKDFGQYTNFVTGRPDYATTGLTVSGVMTPKSWIVPGYTIKLVYKAASSTTARDGSWTLSYRKVGEENYSVLASVTGMNINSAPYGSVHFGIEMTAVTQMSFGEFKCYTQDNESVKLENIIGKNKFETYSALNGVVEAPLKNYENKIFNGSYEIVDENNAPYGWTNSATGSIVADTTTFTEGEKSALITDATSLISEKIDVKPGKYHNLVIDAKSANALSVGVKYYTIDGSYISEEKFNLQGTGSWKEYLNEIYTPANASSLKVVIETADGFSGNVDGLHIYQISQEYITDKVAQSASASELYTWLSNPRVDFGTIVEANSDKYFAEVKDAIENNGGLTADVLADCVYLANTPAIDFTQNLIENGNFAEIDEIGVPVDWVWMTDDYVKGAVKVINGGVQILEGSTIRSRDVKFEAGKTYMVAFTALETRTLSFGVAEYDEEFNEQSSYKMPIVLKQGEIAYSWFNPSYDGYVRISFTANETCSIGDVKVACVDDQLFESNFEALCFPGIKGANNRQTEIKSDLYFLTSLPMGAQITWSSSNPSVIANDGKVTRPGYGANPVMVTVTATVTLGSESFDKPFNFVVLPTHYDEYTTLTLNNDGFEDTRVRKLEYQTGVGVNAENEVKDYDYGGYITANNAGKYSFSRAYAYAGNYSIKIASTAAKSDLRSEQVFDIREGTTYTAAVMAYTVSESVAPNVTLMFFDYKGLEVGNYSASYNLNQKGTWQNLIVSAPAPVGAVSAAVRVQVPNASVDATYFDEIRLYREETVDNYDFNFGTNGWTTSGNVSVDNNKLVLNNATATSSYVTAKAGAIKVVNSYATITSGQITATMTYYNASKVAISTKSVTLTQSGGITISDYAPAGTAYVNAKFTATGAASISPVTIDTAPVGSRIYDDNFALFANGANTGWEGVGVYTAAENNVTVTDGTEIKSSYVTLQEGKKYVAVANLTDASATTYAAAKLELYNYDNQLADTYNLTLSGKTLSYTFDCPLDGYYVRLILTSVGGETSYKNANFYPVASSVSNAGFEIVDAVVSGTHPIQWSVYGDVGVYAASNEADPEKDVFNLLHMLEVVNHNGNVGGVRSAMMEGIIPGRSYTAGAWIKVSAGKATIYIDYYNSRFELLKSYSADTVATGWTKTTVKGDAPTGTAYATVRLEKSGADGALYADQAEILPTIIIVDTTQHFIDDYIIEESENVEREFHQAELGEIVMGAESDTPWQNGGAYIYGTVLFDEDEQIYKMWYMACSDKGIFDAYATSTDGINWEKPTLLKYNFSGSAQNNIIGGNDFPSVFKDYDAVDPSKRYVMITFNELQYAHMIKYSADGINWVPGPVFMKSGDVLTGAWNEYYDKYVMLAKRGRVKRDFYTITSSDTTSFTVGVDATTLATPLDAIGYQRTDCYGAGLYGMYDSWLAFDWLDKIPGTAASYGKVEIGFGFTRDIEEDWTRPYGTNLIVPDTDTEGRIWYSMYSASYPIVVKDEIWLYMGNWRAPHEVGDDECAIQIAKWRKDGFASMNFGDTEGSLTTKQMIFSGNKLVLNANVLDGGFLKVALVDKDGREISGYTENDCEIITTDGTAIEVKWNGSSDLSALVGETVTMKFYGQNAELYTFTFDGAGEGSSVEGESVTLDNAYDYETEITADGYIVAPNQSTLMSGDSASLEMIVKSTPAANTEFAVGIFGQEEAQAVITNAETIFAEGYTVKVEYVFAEGDQATVNVYRKLTDGGVYGDAVFSETGLKSVMFARLALIANTATEMDLNGITFAVNGTPMSGMIVNGVTFTEIAKELEDLGPQRIVSTAPGVYGYNEGIDLGYGENITFQFDCLEYINTEVQIRLAVTDADVKSNATNAGAYKNGNAGNVMGFTSTGAHDWYGGTESTSKTISTFFLPGYTYKFVYYTESASGKGDAYSVLYECPTSTLGKDTEKWTAVYTTTGHNNTAGGNCFAPTDNVKINIFFGGANITMSIDNAFVTASTTVQSYNNFFYSGVTVTESDAVAPEIVVSTAKTITTSAGDSAWGYNDGVTLSYGDTMTMQFDVLEADVSVRWAFYVTENNVAANASSARGYTAAATNILGFAVTTSGGAASIMDWFGGTSYGKSFTAGTFFQEGMSYRIVYTTATSTSALDAMLEIFLCETAKIGTTNEKWECYMYTRGFGDTTSTSYDAHPTNNVKFGLWTNAAGFNLSVDNLKVTTSKGLEKGIGDITTSGSVSITDYSAE